MQKALDTLHSSSSPQMDENSEAELVNGKGAKRTDYMHGCDADDAPWQILPAEQNVLPSGKRNSTSRVQSRFILSCIGSPLQHFKNLKELLSALRDIVKGEQFVMPWIDQINSGPASTQVSILRRSHASP